MLGSKVAADGPHPLSMRLPRPPPPPPPFSALRIDVQSFYDAFVISLFPLLFSLLFLSQPFFFSPFNFILFFLFFLFLMLQCVHFKALCP